MNFFIYPFFLSLIQLLLFSVSLPAQEESLPCYNTVISHRKKFVWFRISKTGLMTISDVLHRNNVISSYNYEAPYDNANYSDYFKFAFVRNPWARIVSCYFNKIATNFYKPFFDECYGKDFDYFVRFIDRQDLETADRHIKLYTKSMPIEEMDFIGRLENFSEDLPYVLKIIGCKKTDYLHKNKSDHAHYSTYYTDETREIIARKYKIDIETFGYEFETP